MAPRGRQPPSGQRQVGVPHAELISFFRHHLHLPDVPRPRPPSSQSAIPPTQPSTDSLGHPTAKQPVQGKDRKALPFIFHQPLPLSRAYDPTTFHAHHLLLALSPSPSLYAPPLPISADSPGRYSQVERRAIFLHRPWGLDRAQLPRGTLVLAEHEAFDSRLTTGHNVPLMRLLLASPGSLGTGIGQLDGGDSGGDEGWLCLQGHKGDPSRRIGLLAPLAPNKPKVTMHELVSRIRRQFPGLEALELNGPSERKVRVVCCLNAFSEEVVRRVESAVRASGWASGGRPRSQQEGGGRGEGPEESELERSRGMEGVLCLTGAAREGGMNVARELGMAVVAVGHTGCEMWGLRYLAEQAREEFGAMLEVVVVDEADTVEHG